MRLECLGHDRHGIAVSTDSVLYSYAFVKEVKQQYSSESYACIRRLSQHDYRPVNSEVLDIRRWISLNGPRPGFTRSSIKTKTFVRAVFASAPMELFYV